VAIRALAGVRHTTGEREHLEQRPALRIEHRGRR
jgi:hypothetical protein